MSTQEQQALVANPSPVRSRARREPLPLLARRLRELRREKGLSLRELGRRIEASASYVSQIENAVISPSVPALYQLAEALDVPPSAFFEEAPDIRAHPTSAGPTQLAPSAPTDGVGPVVRRGSHPKIEIAGGAIWYCLTPVPEDGLDFIESVYPPGASSGRQYSRHVGREYWFIVEGELVFELGFSRYELRAGDSMVYDSHQPHRITNKGAVPARVIVTVLRGGLPADAR